MGWHLYLLRCGDGTLYCGIALDVEARLEAHRSGKGARYTRGRGPLELLHVEACPSRSQALRREREVKALRREAKLALARRGGGDPGGGDPGG
jgi:predicted GIY-YIG superfamily endonuclease